MECSYIIANALYPCVRWQMVYCPTVRGEGTENEVWGWRLGAVGMVGCSDGGWSIVKKGRRRTPPFTAT